MNGAGVLDLEHRPLPRLVRIGEALGHHAVEPGALEAGEPVGRDRSIAGRRSRGAPAASASGRFLELLAPCLERQAAEDPSSPSAIRSQTTSDAGDSAASIATREAAGWIRRSSASNSSPFGPAITTSPSITQRSGRLDSIGAASSGK